MEYIDLLVLQWPKPSCNDEVKRALSSLQLTLKQLSTNSAIEKTTCLLDDLSCQSFEGKLSLHLPPTLISHTRLKL